MLGERVFGFHLFGKDQLKKGAMKEGLWKCRFFFSVSLRALSRQHSGIAAKRELSFP